MNDATDAFGHTFSHYDRCLSLLRSTLQEGRYRRISRSLKSAEPTVCERFRDARHAKIGARSLYYEGTMHHCLLGSITENVPRKVIGPRHRLARASSSSEMGHPLKIQKKITRTRTTDSRGMRRVRRLMSNCWVQPLCGLLSALNRHWVNMRTGGLLDGVLPCIAFGFGRLLVRLRQVCATTYSVRGSRAHPPFRNQLVALIGSPASAQSLRLVCRSWAKLKLARSCLWLFT